ncbi:MAG: hypothetical protein ABI237_05795 [Ginsengibacter sp.]
MKPLFFISLIILFSACKKDKSSVPQLPSYKITAVTRIGRSINSTYKLSYDGNGRISQVVCEGPYAYTNTYSYKGDNIYIKGDVPKVENSHKDTITLSSFNLISTRKVTIQQSVYHASYNYDGSGKILSLTAQQGNYTFPAINYTISDGDITNTISQGITDTSTYYMDKVSVSGNLDDFYQLINNGSFYFRNKHLKKSLQSGNNKTDYSYAFDSDGKIISVISNYNFGAAPDTTNFTYTKQ